MPEPMPEPVSQLFDLTGKVAVVTGCRRGIGLAIAQGLADAGADIIGVSAGLEESGSTVAQLVAQCGRTFRGYRVDLADPTAVRALANPREGSTSTRSPLATSARTIPSRCATTPTATPASSPGSRPAAGARPMTSSAPRYFSPHALRTTCTARSSRSTADGSAGSTRHSR